MSLASYHCSTPRLVRAALPAEVWSSKGAALQLYIVPVQSRCERRTDPRVLRFPGDVSCNSALPAQPAFSVDTSSVISSAWAIGYVVGTALAVTAALWNLLPARSSGCPAS